MAAVDVFPGCGGDERDGIMAGADDVAVEFVGLPDLDVEGAAEAGDVC